MPASKLFRESHPMIVGIGEVLWDVFPDGRKVAGGAPFNFAFHCRQLGHPAAIVSRVGDDDLGRELRDRVRELGLTDEYIQTDLRHPTGTVRVTVDAKGQPTYEIDMNAAWGGLEWTPALADLARQAPAVCHGTLALNGGAASREVIHKTVRHARPQGGIAIYDINLRAGYSDRPDPQAVDDSPWLKVNEDELSALMTCVGTPSAISIASVANMLDRLRGPTVADRVLIVTRGAEGGEVFTLEERFREPAPETQVVDTVGAGDAFTAAMVCLHLEGRPLSECLRFSNHYAARVCEHQGATPRLDRREVELTAFARPE